jgi:hypothetical protein
MKNEKVKIEIDLIRDTLRNIFIVMFAIMSGEVSLLFKMAKEEHINYMNLSFSIFGFIVLIILQKVKHNNKQEIKNLLKNLEE